MGRRAPLRPGILAAIAAGGMIGATARYIVGQVVPEGTFPWSTWIVNVTGSFLLAVAVSVMSDRYSPSAYLRPFVATGVLGSYTTFSAVMVESGLLVRGGDAAIAAAYLATTLVAGLAAAWAGLATARLALVRTTGDRPNRGTG